MKNSSARLVDYWEKSLIFVAELKKRSGCSTVGSAPRSGRGGRKFESSHPDKLHETGSNSVSQTLSHIKLCRIKRKRLTDFTSISRSSQSGWEDSNFRPHAPQTRTLTWLSYTPLWKSDAKLRSNFVRCKKVAKNILEFTYFNNRIGFDCSCPFGIWLNIR